jgi:hypothetical protein
MSCLWLDQLNIAWTIKTSGAFLSTSLPLHQEEQNNILSALDAAQNDDGCSTLKGILKMQSTSNVDQLDGKKNGVKASSDSTTAEASLGTGQWLSRVVKWLSRVVK